MSRGEGLAELGVAHGVAAVFHDDGLVLVALHVGQRLGEQARLLGENFPQLVADAARLEEAADLVVEVHRAGSVYGAGHCSRTTTDRPSCASRTASTSPDGPAPTIATSQSTASTAGRHALAQRLVTPGADAVVQTVVVPVVADDARRRGRTRSGSRRESAGRS